jgi:hypothetical protein
MRVRIRRFGGLGTFRSQRGKAHRKEVGIPVSEFERGAEREAPGAVGTRRGLRRVSRLNPTLAEPLLSRSPLLPLLPDHRPKSTPKPLVQFL